MDVYAYEQNQLVKVDTQSLTGLGRVKGVVAAFPSVGHLFIVEMEQALPREDYPFSSVCLPEGCLSRQDENVSLNPA